MKFRRLGIQRILFLVLFVLGVLQLLIHVIVPNIQRQTHETIHTTPIVEPHATTSTYSDTNRTRRVINHEVSYTVRVPLTLVVAYMRGGSTFTADILRRPPGTYYLFEPIRHLLMRLEEKQPFLLMNGTEIRFFNDSGAEVRFIAEIIRNWFLCQPENVDHGSLLDTHFRFEMPGLSSFFTCEKDVNGDRIMTMKKCLPILKGKCLSAKARIIKIVATRMDVVKHLLQILPTVKIVHVIRDPRAIINSQKRTGLIDRRKFFQQAEKVCKEMQFDLDVLGNILLYFNSSIKVLLYEDFAKFPLETAREMYKFAGLPFTDTVENFVRKIALMDYVTSRCMFCSSKGNSLLVSMEWRFRVKDAELKMSQTVCGDVMRRLQYKAVPDIKALTDTSTSLRENGTLNLIA